MKTVRSFANEEEEAEVYSRKLQQVYKLNRKEAAAYTYYVWGSGVCAPGLGRSVGGQDTKMEGSPDQDVSLGPSMSVSAWSHLTLLCPSFCFSTGESFWEGPHSPGEYPRGAPPLSLLPGHGVAGEASQLGKRPCPGRESPQGQQDPT